MSDGDADAVSSSSASTPENDSVLVQYVVMRSDLTKSLHWNVGGLIANGSHACLGAIADHLDDADVRSFLGLAKRPGGEPLTQMHAVVLSVKDEEELRSTAELLSQHSIAHLLWVEAPEQVTSCLATRPYQRSVIQPILKHLKLFR